MTANPDHHPADRLNEGLRRYADRQAQLLAAVGTVGTGSNRYATRVAAHRAPSVFDDLIAAVTSPAPAEPAVQPPRSRYMVRVAKVGRPHRPTRRNYDYFGELNAKLAAQREARDAQAAGTESAAD